MDDSEATNLEQIRGFLAGSEVVRFARDLWSCRAALIDALAYDE